MPVQINSNVPGGRGAAGRAGRRMRVSLGNLVATRAVDRQLLDQAEGRAFALACLQRHSGGDWGDLDVHDAEANDLALVTGARILSSYRIPERVRSGDGADGVRDERLWIITEAEDAEGARPQTTLLFPSDY
ncbi:MAG: hypothetical protein OXH20_01775 [bacterium]|nr:hypothetical protein [bacterium]